MKLTGKVWKYGANVDTDAIIPARHLSLSTPEELARHCMEDVDSQFVQKVQPGDIIVATTNFGCGSSREQPVLGLKAVGVKAIVAKGFARIFYRASINQGMLLGECPEAVDAYQEGDEVELDVAAGKITVGGKEFGFPKLPEEILKISEAGGLLPYTRAELKKEKQ